MGWVTSPGNLGWKKCSRALEGLDGDQSSNDFVMFDNEVESLFYRLRWFGLWKPSMVFDWFVL